MRHYIISSGILFSMVLASACAPITVGRANGEMADYVDHYDAEGNLVDVEKRPVVSASAYGMNAMDQAANFGEADGRRRLYVAYGNLYGNLYGQSPYMYPTVVASMNGMAPVTPKTARVETSSPRTEAFRSSLIKDCVDGKRGTRAQCEEWVDCKLFGPNHVPDKVTKVAMADTPPPVNPAPTPSAPSPAPCLQNAVPVPPAATPAGQLAATESKDQRAAWERVNREIAASTDADELADALARIPNVLASDDRNVNPALAQLPADLNTWLTAWKTEQENAELAIVRIIARRMAATHFQVNEEFLGALTALRNEADKNRRDGNQSEKLRVLAGRVVNSIDKITGREPEEEKKGSGKGKKADNNKKGGVL